MPIEKSNIELWNELPADDVVDKSGNIAKKRIKSDMQEAKLKKIKAQSVKERKEWLKKEFNEDEFPGISNIHLLTREDLEGMFKGFSPQDKKEVLLHKIHDSESIISTEISYLKADKVDKLNLMFEGLSAKDKKKLLLQNDSKGNSLVKQVADQGNTKAIDIMLKDLSVSDKRKLLTQKGQNNKSAIDVIIESRNKAAIEWLRDPKNNYLSREVRDAIDRNIISNEKTMQDAYANKDEFITDEALGDMGSEAQKQELKKRENSLKESISDYNAQIDEVKRNFKEEIGAEDTSVTDLQNNMENQKKNQKNSFKVEQSRLGNEIRQDRWARWSGGKFGKFSNKTREELRETQKMLGRVIRSDQRTGVIDKAMESAANLKQQMVESASNLKNKVFSKKGDKIR